MATPLETASADTLLDWMRERRSIRRYRPEPLPDGVIEPSRGGQQLCGVVAIADQGLHGVCVFRGGKRR